jgi:type I restriction-modification system DNA methylase subunit
MRIAGVERLGYYPTPPRTLQLIANALTIPSNTSSPVRLLDPCAGQGEALAHLTTHLRQEHAQVQSYGIELADSRAPLAANVLDQVLHADYRDANLSQYAWGLLYLNPPYDRAPHHTN